MKAAICPAIVGLLFLGTLNAGGSSGRLAPRRVEYVFDDANRVIIDRKYTIDSGYIGGHGYAVVSGIQMVWDGKTMSALESDVRAIMDPRFDTVDIRTEFIDEKTSTINGRTVITGKDSRFVQIDFGPTLHLGRDLPMYAMFYFSKDKYEFVAIAVPRKAGSNSVDYDFIKRRAGEEFFCSGTEFASTNLLECVFKKYGVSVDTGQQRLQVTSPTNCPATSMAVVPPSSDRR